MSELRSDLRIALRTLCRSPGFFATATLVLGLGVAAVAVMFAFLRATATPPPLERVDRVFALTVVDVRHDNPDGWVRLQELEDWAAEQRSFEGIAGCWGETVTFRLEGGSAERLAAGRVAGPFFETLRVRPLLGRGLTRADARPGAPPVAVLSERFWRSALGADPAVVGAVVRVNGEAHTVVGVAPAALDLPVSASLWYADRTDTGFDPQFTRGVGPMPRLIAPTYLPIARLRDGVTPEAARAELRAIQGRRTLRHPEVAGELPDVRPLSILWLGPEYPRLLRVLVGGVLLVLLLAGVNVAGLFLVRGAGRTHEAAVRRALGAGRGRLAVQMLAEAVVVGAVAALVASTVAAAALEVLRRAIPALLPTAPSWWSLELDGPALLVAVATAAAATLGAALYPAVRAARVSIDPLLREGTRDTGLHAVRIVRWLVVAEIALSAALLTTAGLVIGGGARLGAGDAGVPTAGYLVGELELPQRYSFGSQRRFAQDLLMRLRGLPAVEAATVTSTPPGLSTNWRPLCRPADPGEGGPRELPAAAAVVAAPGYFETFGIRVEGRTFRETDRDPRTTVGVVSRSMARALWPGESPIGKVLRLAPAESWLPPVTVVGIADDVRYDQHLGALGTKPPAVYVPLTQWPSRRLFAVMRARDPRAAADALRAAVHKLDVEVPVFAIRTLDEARQRGAAGLVLVGRMFAAFGAVALLLAGTGIYGVLASSVAQGEKELAIRRALGAPPGRLALAVLARSGWQLALGLVLGLVLAPVVGAMVGTVIAEDGLPILTYLWVDALLCGAVLAAVVVPLRRALAVEPAVALRHR